MNQHETRIDEVVDSPSIAGNHRSRARVPWLRGAASWQWPLRVDYQVRILSWQRDANEKMAKMTPVSNDSVTDAGEPIIYLNTPNPEISSAIMSIPPGATTEWMTHPVQGYVYVLEGTLTVEFADGPRKEFKAGQGFPQARSKWHRGRNDGTTPMRFLAVFFGGKDVPNVLNPPKTR